MSSQPHRTVPGLGVDDASTVSDLLQERLVGLIDLQLTLKHIHWNVVGPDFISVHEMLDEHVIAVRDMVDAAAERIATLGGAPVGTPGALVARRTWDDYPHGRALTFVHLRELDEVYAGVISDHRRAMEAVGDLDPVTEDLFIGQLAKLELYQWFVRSFIERAGEGTGPTEPSSATRAADRRDAGRTGDPGSAPTASEAAAADRHADDVDLGAVEEPYREMTRIGADVQGEGRIG